MGGDNITKASTMQEVLKAFPGAQRALFSRYHIGGCSHCGFDPTETLEQVSRRNNLLDVQEVMRPLSLAFGDCVSLRISL